MSKASLVERRQSRVDGGAGVVPGGLERPLSEWVLQATGIEKRFGRLRANDGIDLRLHSGEIHGLLGENGAGKSTLVKLLAGIHQPDAGEFSISGQSVSIDSPRASRDLGIAVVHQSSSLVPALTVAENTLLLTDRLGRIDPSLKRRVSETASALGFEIDPEARVGRLSVGQRQRAEIVRALMHEARLILLDEPTAVLAPQERDDLFALLRRLADRGTGVVLVTHRLDEALTQCDRLTVLRHGKVVEGSRPPGQLSEEQLVRMLVGEVSSYARNARATGEVVVEATGLNGAPPHGHTLHGIDLSVSAGEVLGIAGVEGNGQRELAAALVGSWCPTGGEVRLLRRPISAYSPRERGELIADIPDDDALALLYGAPVWQNLALGRLAWEERPGPWARRRLRKEATHVIEQFEIKSASVDTPVGRLSGGNRRRVMLARELSKSPRLVVASYATKGLDIRSTEAIKAWVGRLANDGAAIVYVASELEELLDLSDRIAVIARGRITGTLSSSEADVAQIGRLMLTGNATEAPAA
jgi:general nucleoside transport system ATP-binding protein